MPGMPSGDECYKFISTGGFSTIAFIMHVAAAEKIRNLYVSSLTVGKKEMATLIALRVSGLLEHVSLFVGLLMKNSHNEKDYGYFKYMVDTCISYGWRFRVLRNHSKVILMETMAGNKYVLETSSNLTYNPNIEQFSFEVDEGLFDFYREFLAGLEGDDYGGQSDEERGQGA
jgi:hypothetical protein